MADLGRLFGADLTEAEVGYLMAEEWAETAEDIPVRPGAKLGLRFSAEEVAALEDWVSSARPRRRRGLNDRRGWASPDPVPDSPRFRPFRRQIAWY